MCFIDYLIKNNIDIIGGLTLKNLNLGAMQMYGNNIINFLNQNESNYFSNKGIYSDEDGYLRTNIIYFLGAFFANYLSLINNEDKKEFIKILSNISMSRMECKSLDDSLEKLGFALEDVYSLKLVKPIITKDFEDIKTKYNIKL